MIDETKCRWGVPAVGGKPRQCPKTHSTGQIVKADDRVSSEAMPLCAEHSYTLQLYRTGTIYREDSGGTPAPVRVRPA